MNNPTANAKFMLMSKIIIGLKNEVALEKALYEADLICEQVIMEILCISTFEYSTHISNSLSDHLS